MLDVRLLSRTQRSRETGRVVKTTWIISTVFYRNSMTERERGPRFWEVELFPKRGCVRSNSKLNRGGVGCTTYHDRYDLNATIGIEEWWKSDVKTTDVRLALM
jgi:hypothetical protein